MNVLTHINEIYTAPYYRRHPLESLRYTYAKWKFAAHRLKTPEEFLRRLNIPMARALSGYDRWRPFFEQVIQRVKDKQGHQGGVSIEDGIILYSLVRSIEPEYLIETGVAAGVSNSFINAALVDNGHGTLYSIELPPAVSVAGVHEDGGVFAWPESGVGWAVPREIRNAIGNRNVLILEDVRHALPRILKALPRVDLFFHDDLHTPDHMYWEYEAVWPHLGSQGLLLSDDSNFAWIRFCRKHGLHEFQCANLQRLTAIRKP